MEFKLNIKEVKREIFIFFPSARKGKNKYFEFLENCCEVMQNSETNILVANWTGLPFLVL